MNFHVLLSMKKDGMVIICLSVFFVFGLIESGKGGDWKTYMHDSQRSGISRESMQLPLSERWRYQSYHPPKPAWPSPAKIDYWHRKENLKPRVNYDRVYHVVSADDFVYFGSSANDKIYCLDALTGNEKWSYFTGGPIRLAPTIYNGKIYVGSDDGKAYCLDGKSGALLWQFEAWKSNRIIPGNERMISVIPIRTGIIVEKGIAYFCAGIFPNEGVAMFALDAATGQEIWSKSSDELSPQGFMLASDKKLFVPTGRSTPEVFNIIDGTKLGTFQGSGGTFAFLDGESLFYGSGDLGNIELRKPDSDEQIASFNGEQIILTEATAYLRSDNEISAINRIDHQKNYKSWASFEEDKSKLTDRLWDLREKRKLAKAENDKKDIDKRIDKIIEKISAISEKKGNVEKGSLLWRQQLPANYSMILVGDALIIGCENEVLIFSINDGKLLGSICANGKAYGLAFANEKLLISTDRGTIHCFDNGHYPKTKMIIAEKTQSPFKKDSLTKEYISAAKHILSETGTTKGYCLVLGCGEGRLILELAKRSELKIIGIMDDEKKVLAARTALDNAGIYGTQACVILGSLAELPFSNYFANLIVSEQALISGDLSTPAEEVFRVLKPYGGIAFIGNMDENNLAIEQWATRKATQDWELICKKGIWVKIQRGAAKGSGEWTHLYANSANTLCSQDSLQSPLQIQWFGRPGPRRIINRHSRPMSSLFKDGRIFIPADNQIIAVDAYNGTPLWELEVPNSRILGALKDCGNMAVIDKNIYIAVDNKCLAIDVEDGKVTAEFAAPRVIENQQRDWGYLAAVHNQLIGTGKKHGASFTDLGKFNSDELEGDFREMVTSDYIFSVNRFTGKKLWSYRNGAVLNSTMTVADGNVYFVESRNKKAINDVDGRMRVDDFCAGKSFLIKLNFQTGRKIWEKPFHFPFDQIMFLAYAKGTVLVTGSFNQDQDVHYGLFAFAAETGEKIWDNSFRGGNTRWQVNSGKPTINGEHGEQWQHPVIIGDTIYQPPYNFNLHTGKKGEYYLTRGGHGCGGLTGAMNYLFARGDNPRIYKLTEEAESGTPLSKVNRPGCWINIIPAGGLVVIPESSSGCTCNYPIQSSFVFVPKMSN